MNLVPPEEIPTASERRKYRRMIREYHGKWWYIIRHDEFPVGYWNQERKTWVGSFYGSATRFNTKKKAEKFAVLIAATNPELLGVLDVIER